jgi:LPS-assembly lipoprotein
MRQARMRRTTETTDHTEGALFRVIRGPLAAVAASAALGGCGFTPLYAEPGVTSSLAAIEVVAPEGRTGYLIRQHLDDALAKSRSGGPAYRMDLQLAEQRFPRGIRIDNVATRYEYVLTAYYSLAALPSGEVAKRGSVRVTLTYDSADQPYAAVAAQQDAQDRAAEQAARQIQLELAVWLAGQRGAD